VSAGTVLGRLTPAWVKRTGLSPKVAIYCGLHDSNAALFSARHHPEIRAHDATVLSTGTWFVAMRAAVSSDSACRPVLPEARDCLVNVDVAGTPIPSARFMGGREIELLVGAEPPVAAAASGRAGLASLIAALESDELILPGLVPGVGPFPKAKRRSIAARLNDERATALAHLYAALVADVSLDLIGSRDVLMVDGRFAQAPIFVQTLAALRPETTVLINRDTQGVARGALQLVHGVDDEAPTLERVVPLPMELTADLTAYRARWRDATERLV
jgi:sugar (pentulose or hexulose) kinase